MNQRTRSVKTAEDLTGNITDGVAFTTESGNQDFIVFLNESQTTIIRHESSDLLAILDELYTDALANGRVRLLSFDAPVERRAMSYVEVDSFNIEFLHFFQYNSLGMGGTSKRVGLPASSKMGLFVFLIMPSLLTTVVHVFASSAQSSWFT